MRCFFVGLPAGRLGTPLVVDGILQNEDRDVTALRGPHRVGIHFVRGELHEFGPVEQVHEGGVVQSDSFEDEALLGEVGDDDLVHL